MGTSTSVKDYYAILGVSTNATNDEIKRAFRDKAKKYHPDVCKLPDAHQKFIEIGEAYEILRNPETRKEYDEFVSNVSSNYSQNNDWDSSYSDFGNAQQDAKAQAENYANMTLEELITSVLGLAFELGKTILVGVDDRPKLTFRDYASLALQGIILTFGVIMFFTGVGTLTGIMVVKGVIDAVQKNGKFIGFGPLLLGALVGDSLVLLILYIILQLMIEYL